MAEKLGFRKTGAGTSLGTYEGQGNTTQSDEERRRQQAAQQGTNQGQQGGNQGNQGQGQGR